MLPPPNADGGGIDVVVPAGAPPAGIPPVAMTAVLAPAPEKEKVTSLTKNNPDTGVLLAYFDATPAYAKTSELPHDPNLALVWSPGESGRMTANKYKRSQVKSLFLKWKDAIAEAAFLSRVETFAELEGALLARIAPAPDLLAIALKAHPFKPFIAEHLPDAWRIFSSVAADAASEPLFVGVPVHRLVGEDRHDNVEHCRPLSRGSLRVHPNHRVLVLPDAWPRLRAPSTR